MTITNILILIVAVLWLVAFVYYSKKLNSEVYNNKWKRIGAQIVAPALMLFFAIYAISYFAVNMHTRGAMISNPEILTDTVRKLEEKEMEKRLEASKEAVKQITEDDSKFAPVIGNVDSEIVIYEFFDYNCGYCKRGHEAVRKLLETEKDVKVVLKAFPIFPPSKIPAKALIASREQGADKVEAFNNMLFETKLIPDANEKANETEMNEKIQAIVFGAAEKAGLDVAKLKKDMEAPAVDEELLRTRQLANKLGIQGTPAFVVADQLFRGYVDTPVMQKAIDDAR